MISNYLFHVDSISFEIKFSLENGNGLHSTKPNIGHSSDTYSIFIWLIIVAVT